MTTIGRSLGRRGRQGDRRERQVRDPGRDRPAHPHRDCSSAGRPPATTSPPATAAAAFGGTTSLSTSACRRRNPVPAALENYFEKIERCKPVIDVGFHIGVTDLAGGGGLEALASCPTRDHLVQALHGLQGAVMVDDETLFKTCRWRTRPAPGHGARRERRRDRRDRQGGGRRGKSDPIWHARTRPMETRRRRRTGRSSSRGSRAPRSTSCTSPATAVERSRSRATRLGRLGRDLHPVPVHRRLGAREAELGGAKYIYTPPPRPKAETGAPLKALQNDVLSVVSTDHCPFNWPDQKGINAVPTRSSRTAARGSRPAAHAARVRCPHRRITMNRFVERPPPRTSPSGSDVPRKGTIAVGSDPTWSSGTRESADDLRRDPALERQHTTCSRGQTSPRPRRSCSSAAVDRRERRARRRAGRGPVRQAGAGRREQLGSAKRSRR